MTRRDVVLALVSVFVGPLVGGLTFIAAASAIDALFRSGSTSPNYLLQYWPAVLGTGYVFGTIPGFVFAVIMAMLWRRLPRLAQRLPVAGLVGAVVSVAVLTLAVFGESLSRIDLVVMASLAASGAMAGIVSLVIVELALPLLARTKAVP
jgi:hypothetical protein